jgi:hypothetical protein
VTDIEHRAPVETPTATAIEDADLDQVVGGDTAATKPPAPHDITITKHTDVSSPTLS